MSLASGRNRPTFRTHPIRVPPTPMTPSCRRASNTTHRFVGLCRRRAELSPSSRPLRPCPGVEASRDTLINNPRNNDDDFRSDLPQNACSTDLSPPPPVSETADWMDQERSGRKRDGEAGGTPCVFERMITAEAHCGVGIEILRPKTMEDSALSTAAKRQTELAQRYEATPSTTPTP